MSLPVSMRTNPTAILVGTLDFFDGSASLQTCTSQTASYTTTESVEFDGNYATGTGTVGHPAMSYIGANTGKVTVDAEL